MDVTKLLSLEHYIGTNEYMNLHGFLSFKYSF